MQHAPSTGGTGRASPRPARATLSRPPLFCPTPRTGLASGAKAVASVGVDSISSMSKEAAAAKTDDESDPVPRNEFGGVYVDEEELRAAFDFFDVHKKGTLVRVFLLLRACSLARGHAARTRSPRLSLCPSISPCLSLSLPVSVSPALSLSLSQSRSKHRQRQAERQPLPRAKTHSE